MSNNNQPSNNNNQKRHANQSPHGGGPRGGGRGGSMMPGEKARDFKGSMSQLIRYLGRFKWAILITLLVASASTIFSIFGPRTLGQATTELYLGVQRIIQNDPIGIDFAKLNQILLRVLYLYLVSALLGLIQGYILSQISARVSYQLRSDLSEKINRLPLSYFDKTTRGEVLSRITNDIDTISRTLNESLSQMITSITRVIGVLIMMLSINLLMTLIGILMVLAAE